MTNKSLVAQVLIRKGEDGFELNYGRQVMGELDGIKFCSEDWYMDMFNLPYTVVEEVPEFLLDFTVAVELGNDRPAWSGACVLPSQWWPLGWCGS